MGHGSSINRVRVAPMCNLVKTRKMSREMSLPGRESAETLKENACAPREPAGPRGTRR